MIIIFPGFTENYTINLYKIIKYINLVKYFICTEVTEVI